MNALSFLLPLVLIVAPTFIAANPSAVTASSLSADSLPPGEGAPSQTLDRTPSQLASGISPDLRGPISDLDMCMCGVKIAFACPESLRTEPVNPELPLESCKCYGCWSGELTQITCPNGGTNPPLITPTHQTVSSNTCALNPICGTPVGEKKCVGSFSVRVTFQGTPCRTSVWVQGGSAFPVPTEVNFTTVQSDFTREASCGQGATAHFKVWYTKPGNAEQDPDAGYLFTMSCSNCTTLSPCPQ